MLARPQAHTLVAVRICQLARSSSVQRRRQQHTATSSAEQHQRTAAGKSQHPTVEQVLEPYRYRLRQRVRWGEMDAFQHLNNVVFFRYAESARINFARHYAERAGLGRGFFDATGLGPILGATSCQYKAPVVYPDVLTVGVRVAEVNAERGSWIEKYAVVSQQQQRLVATLDATIVFFDYSLRRRTPLPPALCEAFEHLAKPEVLIEEE